MSREIRSQISNAFMLEYRVVELDGHEVSSSPVFLRALFVCIHPCSGKHFGLMLKCFT